MGSNSYECCDVLKFLILFLVQNYQVAERLQLFSKYLRLPPIVYAKVERRLATKDRRAIDTLIHLHYQVMSTYFDRLKRLLPEQERHRLERSEKEVTTLLNHPNNYIDGFCPWFAYRRLLMIALRSRTILYEASPDLSGLLTPIRFSGSKLLLMVQTELELVERTMLDGHTAPFFTLYASIARDIAIKKIQKVWRLKLKTLRYSKHQQQHVTFGE